MFAVPLMNGNDSEKEAKVSKKYKCRGKLNMDGCYVWTHCDDEKNFELYECFMGEDYLQVKRYKNGEKTDTWSGIILKDGNSAGIHFINTKKIENCHNAEYVKRLVEECHKHSVYNAEQIESMGVI